MKNSLASLKILVAVVFALVAFSVINSSLDDKMYEGLSQDDTMLYRFIKRQGAILGKKYQMEQCASGLGGMDKVWLMCLSFNRYGDPLNEMESRKLMVSITHDYLEAVNNDKQLRPLLKDFPFTPKNLKLKIFNYDKDQIIHKFPNIGVVFNSEGKLGFFTEDPLSEYGYKTEKYETYDEAVAILKRENTVN